jgi:hypothetical protein
MIVANGISNPIDFGFSMFFVMEFFTVIIETIVAWVLLKKVYKIKEDIDVLVFIIAINVCSALFCFPFWGTLSS